MGVVTRPRAPYNSWQIRRTLYGRYTVKDPTRVSASTTWNLGTTGIPVGIFCDVFFHHQNCTAVSSGPNVCACFTSM